MRDHLRRLARQDRLGEQVVAVGPWWRDAPEPVEVDALVLATERRLPVLAAAATWATTVDGARVARVLERKLQRGPGADTQVRLAVAAREEVTNASGLLAITADDGFA